MIALYSVGTWSIDKQAFTPQQNIGMRSYNIPLWQLKRALKQLRRMGYTAHRLRDSNGEHDDNDLMVLVERTDGQDVRSIRRRWRR